MEEVKYDFGYMFSYSERPNTQAQRKLDDVPKEIKKRRLQEIIDLQMKHSLIRNKEQIGKSHIVLVEGVSKKSKQELYGRNSQNTVIVFPKDCKPGDYVLIYVESCTSNFKRKSNKSHMIKHQETKQRFGIVGNSSKLDQAISVALQIAPTDISALITGESGVGKESMPKIIHFNSQRKHNKYVAVNCGAIPEGTIDSELFGHEKGAFTGASDNRKGYFEVADGGTIFLDEVGELPLSTQVRLLRVLESGEFMKVGSSQSKKVNVRVIAATNVNIENAINKGKFREDLYYRLNTINIKIPSLKERIEDIHLLFRKFSSDLLTHIEPTDSFKDEAIELLHSYSWPGNIRQLKNIVEQISAIEQDISLETLKIIFRSTIQHLFCLKTKK